MTVNATEYFQRLSQLLTGVQVTDDHGKPQPLDEGIQHAVDLLLAVRDISAKVMLVGNGGSAAIVSHMHNDLIKCAGIKAMTFHETPLLTAYTNDEGYEAAYERQLTQWLDAGDVLIAISSSGKSPNILRCAQAANLRDAAVITMSGFKEDNPLRMAGYLNFYVPDHAYGMVELVHGALGHLMTDAAAEAVGLQQGHEANYEIEATRVRDGRSGIRRRRASA